MNIPDEAIEAAALAMAQIETGDDGVTVANEIDIIHARAALEAATPIMASALFDAGYRAGYSDGWDGAK